jgi:hypothetical protein
MDLVSLYFQEMPLGIQTGDVQRVLRGDAPACWEFCQFAGGVTPLHGVEDTIFSDVFSGKAHEIV